MRKLLFVLFSGLMLTLSVAKADQVVELGYIDTDNCDVARTEVSLLSSLKVNVTPLCSDYIYQGYQSNNGRFYNYRLYTSVTVPGVAYPGTPIELAFINTNNCERARNEILLLNSAAVTVDAVCSEYAYQGYKANNGRFYNYRLYTTLTVN